MASLVNFGRLRRGLLLVALVGAIAGCGSDGDVAAPPPVISASSSETSVPFSEASAPSILDVLEVDDSELMPLSIITDSLVPEITADDIVITGGDGGTSYLYVFPTRELSDGVSLDLEARWDSVDDGLQPSLTWNLTGGESSPSDFVFVASLPKSFAETVDDVVFDPEPDEIIDPDPLVDWLVDFLTTGAVSFSATSKTTVSSDEAVDVIGSILDQANSVRLHSELSACTKWRHHIPSLATCLLAVAADNPGHFGVDRCDDLGLILRGFNPYREWGPMLSLACQNVVGLARYAAPVNCVAPSDPVTSLGCLKMVWQLLAGACEDLDPLDQQICVYEAAFAVGDQERCASLDRLGNPEMANDCRAAITKDPSYCAKAEDPDLRASCCENFRGTDAYDTCLGLIGEASAGEDTTTTVDEATATTEPGEEDIPPAIPAGVYTGSFDARIVADYFNLDSGLPDTNTINVMVDDSGVISGDLYAHQMGSTLGCPGAEMAYSGTIDPGQVIGPTLPQSVTATVTMTWSETLVGNTNGYECISPPVVVTEVSPEVVVLESIQNGVLTGKAGNYLQFKLE